MAQLRSMVHAAENHWFGTLLEGLPEAIVAMAF